MITGNSGTGQALKKLLKYSQNTNGKFNYIVSNPPYQLTKANSGKIESGISIWQEFILLSSYSGKKASFINPSRWQKGANGSGMSTIRSYLLNSGHLIRVINYGENYVFKGINVGGVTIEFLDFTTYHTEIINSTVNKDTNIIESFSYVLSDNKLDIFIPPRDMIIISKILDSWSGGFVDKKLWVSGLNNFTKRKSTTFNYGSTRDYALRGSRLRGGENDYFISAAERGPNTDYIKVFYYDGKAVKYKFLPEKEFTPNADNDNIKKYKSFIPNTHCQMIYRNITIVGGINSIATDSWLGRSFDSANEVLGFNSYVQTYFYRYLVSVRRISLNAYRNIHHWVPDLVDTTNPRTCRRGYDSDWTDEDLKVLFNNILTAEDWEYIKSSAIAADKGMGDYESGYYIDKPMNLEDLFKF